MKGSHFIKKSKVFKVFNNLGKKCLNDLAFDLISMVLLFTMFESTAISLDSFMRLQVAQPKFEINWSKTFKLPKEIAVDHTSKPRGKIISRFFEFSAR